ncbi:hypothetical protein COO60DRAFT_195932 [Scenedesmus sp. NREL 46B-D3]|nr:hypothetical protein COO60DRAFT_195932 [Scenedesmus sp. NREL 46B-D3]
METIKTRRYVICGAAAGAATYMWLRSGSRRGTAADATDFDSFLRAPPSVPEQAPVGTTFESFLREQPEQPASTDFASFLRNRSSSAQPAGNHHHQQQQQQAASKPVEHVPETAVPVLVLYGTEYGFAREIAEKLSQQLKESGKFWPCLVNAAHQPEGYDLAASRQRCSASQHRVTGAPHRGARLL